MSWFSRAARWTRRNRPVLLILSALLSVEWLHHINSLRVSRPSKPVDTPFFNGCQEPDVDAPRENAVIVMLARNNEAATAAHSVRSLEKHFNQWFQYPIVFLNDVAWDKTFIDAVSAETRAEVSFEVIPADQWGYPGWIDQGKARQSMKEQEARGLLYAAKESYHHMCRFNSGKFYEHPALRKYKWYWRVDSDVEFTCTMSYDPFRAMARTGKRYGYAMALWERGDTAPTLFRKVSDFKEKHGLATSPLLAAMTEPSWGPFLLRKAMRRLQGRNADGDGWNYCHFWSNFEIADMDFFRSPAYSRFFDFLDRDGGFYFERWGDAPVHSFGVGLYLKPHEVHYFEDFGYIHDNIQHCPINAKGRQLPDSKRLGPFKVIDGKRGAVGCRCECQPNRTPLNMECQNLIGRALG